MQIPIPKSLLFIVLIFLGYWLLVFGMQRLLIFPGTARNADQAPLMTHPGIERWWIDRSEARVEAWMLPGRGLNAQNPGPALVFAHGNGELIDDHVDLMSLYHTAGISVLAVEYRGYGRSSGNPSQEQITADFAAAYDRLIARPEVDASRIVFHGRSLGGGIVCSLGRIRRPAGLILQSSFTGLAPFARRMAVPSFLLRDPMKSADFVQTFEGPVLVLHGVDDEVVPFSHGVTLADAAANGVLRRYPTGHNNFPHDWKRYTRDLLAFMAQVDPGGQEMPSGQP